MKTSLVDEEDLVQKGCNSRYNTFALSIPMVSLTTIGQILIFSGKFYDYKVQFFAGYV